MQASKETYARGLELVEKLHGGHAGQAMIDEMREVCPDFSTMTIEWALAGIMGRPGLDLLTRELLLVASCVTLANAEPQLKAHIDAARKLGASREQVNEAILTLLFYAGGPAVRNALMAAHQVFNAEAA